MAHPAANAAIDCPAYCGIDHRSGITFHAQCAGELRRKQTSVVVVVTRRENGDGVELAYHARGRAPAIAFLSGEETRELRDYLANAVELLDAA